MNRSGVYHLCAALALLLGAAAPAAQATELRTRVPASACKPINEADFGKVVLDQGAWHFDDKGSGNVTLICPVQLVFVEGTPHPDVIVAMRLWYTDPSGTAPFSQVTARLLRRGHTSGLEFVGGTLNSNSFALTEPTRVGLGLAHVPDWDYVYHVGVTIFRNGTNTQTPVFTGVDFWNSY